MPSDTQLFVEWKTRYDHLPQARAAEVLAEEYQLEVNSVRSRLNRAQTSSNHAQVIRHLATVAGDIDPSVERQMRVIKRSEEAFNEERKRWRLGMFISDIHFPYTRYDALELAYLIAERIRPDVISAQNDLMDNGGRGRWEDDRTLRGKLWASDSSRQMKLQRSHYGILRNTGRLVEVAGNHDLWYYNNLRSKLPEDAEEIIADYMEMLENEGVLVFTRGFQENAVHLSPGLVWYHGVWASRLATTNAINAFAQFKQDGVAKSVTIGHTHRPSVTDGVSVREPGRRVYNNGTLSRLEAVPYLKADPIGWGLGVTINRFDPNSRWEAGEVVEFYENGDSLQADYSGVTYRVRLDKSTPEY